MESTPYCISRGKAAGMSYFRGGNMIGNTMKLIMFLMKLRVC